MEKRHYRYLLFGGFIYYGTGGAHDILGASNHLDLLLETAKDDDNVLEVEWWHIYMTRLNAELLKLHETKLILHQI